jgi:hypothetical protein
MSKKNSAVMDAPEVHETSAIAPVKPTDTLARPMAPAKSRLEGGDRDDQIMPRIHMFQGLPAEVKEYGKGYSPGDLINTVTREKIEQRNFIPILGYKEWLRWKEPRGTGLEYKKRIKTDVPPEDLVWNEAETDPKKRQPRATETINWLVMFDGDAMPVVLGFSRTSLNAGKTINTLETMRGNRGPGLYSFDFREKSNDKGAWVTPVIRPVGDPSPEMVQIANLLFESFSGTTIETNPDNGEFDPDAA